MEILEIDGYDHDAEEILTHSIYEYREEPDAQDGKVSGRLIRTGDLRKTEKLERAGITLTDGRPVPGTDRD